MGDESPAELLDHIHRLRRHTSARVHGAGLPLTVIALLTFASMLLYREPFYVPHPGTGEVTFAGGGTTDLSSHGYSGLPWLDRSAELSIMFWLIVAPLCYAGCAWWYRRRAERLGVAMRWQPWVYAGVGLLAGVIAIMVARSFIPYSPPGPFSIQNRGERVISPLLAVTAGLLVLARVERSWGVAVTALIYGTLSTVMNAFSLGELPPPLHATEDPLIPAGPNLILLAAVLLIGAACRQLQARARRHHASEALT